MLKVILNAYQSKRKSLTIFSTGLLIFTLLGVVGCDKDDNNTPQNNPSVVDEQKAVDALIQVLQQRGLQPDFGNNKGGFSEPNIEDYVNTSYDGSGDLQLYADIGPDGHLIPGSDWRTANPDYCKNQNQYMKAPVKRLNYKVFKTSGGYEAFAQYINIATGKVEEQREAEASTLQDALDQSTGKMQSPIKKATEPCGEEGNWKLVFESETTFSVSGTTFDDQVKAEVSLSYDENTGTYSGEAPLRWTNISVNTSSSSVTYQCSPPADAKLKVVELYAGADGTKPDSIRAKIQILNWHKAPCTITASGNTVNDSIIPGFAEVWQVMHVNENTNTIIRDPSRGVMTNESIYTITGWTGAGNTAIQARKEYNRTHSQNGAQFSEATTLEFYR